MDKPAKKAIIIKVNGKEQPYTTETSTLSEWSSDDSDERYEEQNDSLQFETDSKRYKKRSPWRSFLLAIALAVVLGTSFGLFVLTIIPSFVHSTLPFFALVVTLLSMPVYFLLSE